MKEKQMGEGKQSASETLLCVRQFPPNV